MRIIGTCSTRPDETTQWYISRRISQFTKAQSCGFDFDFDG